MRLLEMDTEDAREETALCRADPLIVEQELDARHDFARALERVLGVRAGRRYLRSGHDHLYAIELGDLGRGLPSTATVFGFWERWEPRPPEHEIDSDLYDLSLWLARATGALDPEVVAQVFRFAGSPGGWPEGSVARTPGPAFAQLPDFAYPPSYEEVEGLRMARIDVAGPATSDEVFLLLHGEPTWSYLYRHMIPVLAEAGRVVVPDLVGFGRSDKPVAASAYSYRSLARWLRKLVEQVDLRDITLVCQDWGGLLGLRLVAQQPERFRRVVAMNTLLPTGEGAPTDAFLSWRRFTQRSRELDVAALMRRAVVRRDFSEAEAAAYAAPWEGETPQTAALVLPRLVPTRESQLAAWENRRLANRLLELDLPALLLFSDNDPITASGREALAKLFRRHEIAQPVRSAGHFLQEDQGPNVAKTIREWAARS